MPKKGKLKINETGPDQTSDTSDTPLPEQMGDETDLSFCAILAAIANLRNEVYSD